MPERIAVIHEWLQSLAGSEQVVEQMLELYPGATIYALRARKFYDERDCRRSCNKEIHTSFIQDLPLSSRIFRFYLPLMPFAVERYRDFQQSCRC
jgi:hypothetical protein